MRLGLAALDALPASVRPSLDPRSIDVGIVHLGVGAFHRAHQAVYTQAAMVATGERGWGICGVSQRSPDVVTQLRPQDGLYTVVERSARSSYAVMAPLRDVLFAGDDTDALLERLANPGTHVVTITVTEKGYRHDPASRRLRIDDAEVRADAQGGPPRTVVGQLVRGFQRRARGGGGPVTVVCCDNLPSNGRTLGRLVEDFCGLLAEREASATAHWIAENVRFPSTMVDRIVPATTAADRRDVAQALGVEDCGAVVTEPFSQWVIEDCFAAPRPAWERAGAILTADVTPYETMKLRLLNGPHSALAYLGLLAGYEYVSDFMAVDTVARYVRSLMDADATPTLAIPDGFDVVGYKDELVGRFENPALQHRIAQISMDGSQKLPQRLLGTIRERRRAGALPRHAALAVAAWMRVVSARQSDVGRPLAVDDPLAAPVAAALSGASTPANVVDALLGLDEVFGPDLRDDEGLRALLVDDVDSLTRHGALACLAAAGS
jgi:fructuronate reductase